MSINHSTSELPREPQWDIADRMRKALRSSDVSVQDMADYLEVSRNTVGRWINGHVEPAGAIVRLWALRTGVSYSWLRDGAVTPASGGPDDGATGGGGLPRLDSNQQPFD